MSNCMIGFPNHADSTTLSAGLWLAALPLNNLKSHIIGKVARSSTAALADTKFDIDLGSEKKIRISALVNHNFSLDAKYRLRASTVSNFATTVYDSGWFDVWPAVYPSASLDWEDANWWSGKYTDEQRAGYTATLVEAESANVLARYWRWEIDDTTNAAGYVQIGRLFIGPAWQPTYNMNYGASAAWETKTEVQEALGGAEYFQRRTPYRVQNIVLDMTLDEGLANAFEIQRRAGIDAEVLWIFDPDDTVHALRRRYLARLRKLSALEYPYFDRNKTAFELKELL